MTSESRNTYTQLNTQYDDGRAGPASGVAGANAGSSNRGQKDVIIRKNSSKTFRPTSTQRAKDGSGEGSAGGNTSNVNVKKKGTAGSKGGSNGSNGGASGGNNG